MDRQVWAKGVQVDHDQTAPTDKSYRDLYCLSFCLHLSDAVAYCKTDLLKFRIITAIFLIFFFRGFYKKNGLIYL